MKKIQVFKPKYQVDEILSEIKECLDIGWTGMGFKTIQFEEAWNQYTGFQYSHYLNSATAALDLAIKVLKLKHKWNDDNEIITTPFTFVSTNHAILYNDMKAVFADIDNSGCLDLSSIKSKVSSKTKAIIFVGLGGNIGQYYDIVKYCQENDIKLVLDAAHMAGTRVNGKIVGTEADITCYSFQAVKNLPTADSGMICTSRKEYDEFFREYAWLGINKDTFARNPKGNYKWKYDVEYVGHKFHGNSIMASIALVQLKVLDHDNSRRREIATLYDTYLQNENITHINHDNCESSRHLYQILVDNRDELLTYLNEHDIFPGVHYIENTQYKMFSYAHGTCLKAEYFSDHILSLPMHMHLEDEDIKYISDTILNFVNK